MVAILNGECIINIQSCHGKMVLVQSNICCPMHMKNSTIVPYSIESLVKYNQLQLSQEDFFRVSLIFAHLIFFSFFTFSLCRYIFCHINFFLILGSLSLGLSFFFTTFCFFISFFLLLFYSHGPSFIPLDTNPAESFSSSFISFSLSSS